MGGSLLSQPWRPLPETKESLNFVKSYKPKNKEVKHLRILLQGPVGAGKSSFINSVDSVLQGRVTGRALTDAISGKSFTRKYKSYKMRKDEQNYCSFILNDIMGFEKNTCDGVHKKDIILALMGHMKEGYEFTPGKRLMENDRNYYSCPTPDDKVHVLVSVVPAGLVSILSDDIFKKMRDVRIAASEIGIPQIALLTKVDEACPKVRKDIKNIYKSKYLKEKSLFLKVLIFHKLLGIPLNCIFLVENYDSTFQINNDKNAQILCALRKMIELGEDYLNELE